jgi:PAS domain S-box-containing protein
LHKTSGDQVIDVWHFHPAFLGAASWYALAKSAPGGSYLLTFQWLGKPVSMSGKPTYEELEDRVRVLEKETAERRRVEEALRESEVRLKTVLDTIQAGIVVIDPETHVIVGVNAAAGRMIGAPREHILGSVCHNYICPDQEGQCPITDLELNLENEERELLTARGDKVPILKTVVSVTLAGREHLLESFLDITARKQAEEERERLIDELQVAFAEVKKLSGLLPICAACKSIRDDKGYWQQIEAYIGDHSEAQFSHSVCPKCARELYPEVFAKREMKR